MFHIKTVEEMKNVAVILAGGAGTRFGSELPKQFVLVAGKPVIRHTVDAFESHPMIDEIAVVCCEEYMDLMEETLRQGGCKKVKHLLKGGKERFHSSLAAINAYAAEDCNLLIHDGARPLVSARLITSCAEALRSFTAVEAAIPATDTIVEVAADGSIARIPPRERLWNAQTPQCFRREVIAEAYGLAMGGRDFRPTDDCAVVHKYLPAVSIKVITGERTNIKITYKSDIALMEKLLAYK